MEKLTTSQRLKQIMNERNLKQVDILKKCDPICEKWEVNKIGSNGLSQYVTGKVEPSQKILSILAEALQTNEVWLMGFDVPNVPKDEYNQAIKQEDEKKLLKNILTKKGFLNENEEMTEEDFNRLIEFAKANKQFIMKDNNKE